MNTIPPIQINTKCPPPLTREQEIEKQRIAVEQLMTVFEHCPKCNKPGFDVSVTPEIVLYPKGVSRISGLKFKITRPCGHADREFSIGY